MPSVPQVDCPDVAVISWRCDQWSSRSWTVLCLACLLIMAQKVADGSLSAVDVFCNLLLRGPHIGHTDSSVAFCLCKSRHLSDVLFHTASLLCPTPVFKQQSCTSIFNKFKLSCFSHDCTKFSKSGHSDFSETNRVCFDECCIITFKLIAVVLIQIFLFSKFLWPVSSFKISNHFFYYLIDICVSFCGNGQL